MPVIHVADPAATRAFYESSLSPDTPTTQLLVTWDSPTAVDPDVRGVAISIEVDDVDRAYRSVRTNGLDIVRDIRDEPWGIRRFFVRNPIGAVINSGATWSRRPRSRRSQERSSGRPAFLLLSGELRARRELRGCCGHREGRAIRASSFLPACRRCTRVRRIVAVTSRSATPRAASPTRVRG